ncbi:MAG TPA: ACT domain-containing protein, partial [Clostridia bacterium]|nr:ACT domain-containing protein [Clostridia bacterium]
LESRMSRLGGQFAGILRVEVPAQNQDGFQQALKNLETKGLKVVVQPDQPTTTTPSANYRSLEIVGQDRPGIVREISRALAEYGVNVEELHTECSSAAMTGETLFTARASIRIPVSCNMSALRQELEKIAADLIVDISFSELPAES